jgi:nicotinamide-nucleotide amidase
MTTTTQALKELIPLLQTHQWKLVTAESCTGGLIAAALTEIPGSSSWFERGFVTYSNESKSELLNVDPFLIRTYGAVSQEVACAMAEGALMQSHGQFALSVTGIAGPHGGTSEKPVGTVCFAWAAHDMSTQSLIRLYQGTRKSIRAEASKEALAGAVVFLKSL